MKGRIVAICGYAQVGKDTFATKLIADHGYTRIGFADPIKQLCYDWIPVVRQSIDRLGAEMGKRVCREVLQNFGSSMKEIFGEDIFARAVLSRVRDGGFWVIPDMRFDYELTCLRTSGLPVLAVRITRPGYGPANQHPSETSVSRIRPDVVVSNDGTIEDLWRKADDLVRSWHGDSG